MNKLVGIRFKPAGKVYDFDAGVFVLKPGDGVIVETEQGLGYGTVAVAPRPAKDPVSDRALKKVFRMAGQADLQQVQQNAQVENQAHAFCLKCIKQLGLKMNLFGVESTFDAGRLTFFFTSEGRVDFRQLVKMLVRELGVRIEMRQVGIRNQAKMCGGLGRCGRKICCASFIEKFEPVSIRMAKEQCLSLNPTKISGQCGRLMCCLTFEYDTYRALKQDFPKIGKVVTTRDGRGKVIRQNVIRNRLTLRMEGGQETEIDVAELIDDTRQENP